MRKLSDYMPLVVIRNYYRLKKWLKKYWPFRKKKPKEMVLRPEKNFSCALPLHADLLGWQYVLFGKNTLPVSSSQLRDFALGIYEWNYIRGDFYRLIRWDQGIYLGYTEIDFYQDEEHNIVPNESDFKISAENFLELLEQSELIKKEKDLLEKVILHESLDGSITIEKITKNNTARSLYQK